MKNNFPILCLLCGFLSFVVTAQTTAIPDANFEDYLETHAQDGSVVDLGDAASMGDGIANNGLVLTNRIDTTVLLDVSNLGISDLTGIEDFVALETLFCSNNDLTLLDISNNTNLVALVCGSNNLTTIDTTNNVNLETLDCSENQIQDLDVANNLALESLTASSNQLSAIDVSNNTELTVLSVSDNRIAGELIVGNNLNIESLFCASNQISILDLSNNTLLRSVDASDNALSVLDLSTMNSVVCPDPQTDPVTACQGSSTINVSRNQLSSLLVNNGFNDLISIFDATDNPDLYCIQIDAGFVPDGWLKDDWTYYSENACLDIYTYVPDDNFEQALIDLGYDDALDNLVLTANINTIIDLNISNNSISSLIGIEDFLALEVLDCSNNTIETIDFVNNIALQEINVSGNSITSPDFSFNTALITLNCAGNTITDLDLSNNVVLTNLNCSGNTLVELNVSSNPLLIDFDCSMNQLERIDVTANTALTSLLCNDNNLFALDLNNGNNNLITNFNATNNANLFCIKVDDVAFANGAANWQKDAIATYNLDCGTYVPDDNFEQALIDQGIDSDGTLNNYVPTIDISGIAILDVSSLAIEDLTGIEDFVVLQELNCSNNNLANLDLSNNLALEILDCSINQITELDFTFNTALTSLVCSNNSLRTLNIENGNNAALVVFNTTANPNLFCINVDDAIVGNIPASWQKDDFTDYDGDCLNNRFTLIPDPFFEQALIDFSYDDVIDGMVLTSNIEHIQTLDVSDESISDLTGIRDCKSLVELDCSGNFLEALDVSDMIYLERLNCGSNYLLTNDVNNANGLFNTTGTTSLRELYCSGNYLNDLDISFNTNLEILNCSDNNISVLNLNGNLNLTNVNCSNNDIANLDISNASVLEILNCDNNRINDLMTSGIINATLRSLSCANNDLSDLQVNNYQALEVLICASNTLTDLIIDNIPTLEFLDFTNNQVVDIDLSNNTNLIEVLASQNELSQLVVSTNVLLENLNCAFNEITQLDLNTNTLLEILSCSNNQLSTLNLSSNTSLIEANFSSNMIESLILANNLGSLKRLDASNNQIEGDIDLTTMAISACVYQPNQNEFCPETIGINLSNNLFDFVNIQNGINTEIIDFNATGNPNLECIQVDDANNIGASWLKDNTTSYNEDCNFGETYVPDDNFEQALINLGLDAGPLNDYVLTANIENLISLDVSGNAIADLTGIEDFTALENLNISANNISEVDLSANTNLLELDCSDNALTELDIFENTSLEILNCSNNIISNLVLTNNTNLIYLDISSNNFTSFLPSEVLTLQNFSCDDNLIVDLDFQQNLSLVSLSCQLNILETLNLRNGQNAILLNLNAVNNPNLTCIETDTGTVPVGATWTIDATAQFAMECFFGQTFVPDDNFEEALIDLGYDSGPLDDYVLTENIEDLTFLNINGREISDVTGIEDFISLVSLNIEDNLLTTIDLSDNVLLINLNVSGNSLTDLNLSNQTGLLTVNAAGNSLTQINLGNNQNLIDLDVSSNQLISLDVSVFTNLEELNCASNEISGLDVTQNPNLQVLFCQSNLLIADQLNLQNGNNENLVLFNATNNQDLACILVDDPTAVIANTDGTYDNWFKDDSASYQIICEDADNDGIPNEDDLCPNTPFGATVDLFGCAVLDLPSDNFAISITGETCLNSNDGKVTIIAQDVYNYTVSLFTEDIIEPTGEDFYQEYNFTNDVDIFNLLAGTYDMCITIEEWPDYESCYTIVITEPNPLEVFASRTFSGGKIEVDMNGSSSYNIEFNGETFTTHNTSLELQLQQGENILKVSTDLECQGSFEKRLFYGNEFLVYPNPISDYIFIYNGLEGDKVRVDIYTSLGQLVLSKSLVNNGSEMMLDTSDLSAGIYVLKTTTENSSSSYKIIKK